MINADIIVEKMKQAAATIARLEQELATCREALNKTAIERDRFHDELITSQAERMRLAMELKDAKTKEPS